jgi:6-phosphogluconolactonase
VTIELEVHTEAEQASRRVGALIASRARETGYRFSFALSKAPPEMLGALVAGEPPWDAVDVFQVDERVAPAGDTARNLVAILEALPEDSVHPMPVEDPDLEDAARRYDAETPTSLDLVHLGLGEDGHTASLIPGDPVLEIGDRRVAVTGEYQGYRRMTLTYPALEAARAIVWLVTGETKREALARLLARDDSIPAGRISNPHQLVVADAAAHTRS